MKRMVCNSAFRHCVLVLSLVAVITSDCGRKDQTIKAPVNSNFGEEGQVDTVPVHTDFGEKPGREVGYIHSHPVGTTVRYDLNGDGAGENITVITHEYEEGKLTIDDVSVEFWSATPTGYFTVLNVNPSRDVLLVGISDFGLSYDLETIFYAYDGHQITEVGYLNDTIGQNIYNRAGAICHGDGTITAERRWDILGTWSSVGLYQVDETGVVDVTNFYPYIDWDGKVGTWEVKAKLDVIMYEQSGFKGNVVTVPAGTVMNMIGVQRGPYEETFWVAFDVGGFGELWMITEKIEWESFVHTGNGFVSSQEAFDGFFYAG